MKLDKQLFEKLFEEAKASERKRINYDFRNCPEDNSQRMLNALLPGTKVAIHRHPMSSETVIILTGKMDEIFYDDNGNETEHYRLCPEEGNYGCVVPKNVWHKVKVLEPSVIFECKDGRYGFDGSEMMPWY